MISIAAHLKKYAIQPCKKLGQHFLVHEKLCDKIVYQSGDISNKVVIEIGPGPGGLTRAILKTNPKLLIIIEKDKRFLPLLEDFKSSYENLIIICKDALNISLTSLIENMDNIVIISNLPYQISSLLLFYWASMRDRIDNMTLMVQKEVANRLCASAGSPTYGRISILFQAISTIKHCFDISPSAFIPRPKVQSSVINIKFFHNVKNELFNELKALTRIVFNQQRKMVKKTLKSYIPDISDILIKLGIDPCARPEELTIEQYINLCLLIINSKLNSNNT